MNKATQNQMQTADSNAAAPSKANSRKDRAPYLHLIDDCWEQIFDHLRLKDIFAMGGTCKRMNEMAGYYFRDHFPNARAILTWKGCRLYQYGAAGSTNSYISLDAEFYQYVRDLIIWNLNSSALCRTIPALQSLKTIFIFCNHFTEDIISNIQHLLDNVENVHVTGHFVADGILAHLAQCCPKLKYLRFEVHNPIDSLYSQHFPSLEYLKYQSESKNAVTQQDELKTFLEKHSNLKHFECDYCFLWANRDSLIQTDIKLNSFGIIFRESSLRTPSFDQFLPYLRILYARAFYKTVHLSFSITVSLSHLTTNTILAIPSLTTLKKVELVQSTLDILPRLTNLKELHLYPWCNGDHMETLAKSVINLEKLKILGNCGNDGIIAFIRYSKELKTLRCFGSDNSGLDLFALNEDRKKLLHARSLTLYLNDENYLATKWKSKFTHFSHIKIARTYIIQKWVFFAPVKWRTNQTLK